MVVWPQEAKNARILISASCILTRVAKITKTTVWWSLCTWRLPRSTPKYLLLIYPYNLNSTNPHFHHTSYTFPFIPFLPPFFLLFSSFPPPSLLLPSSLPPSSLPLAPSLVHFLPHHDTGQRDREGERCPKSQGTYLPLAWPGTVHLIHGCV